MNPERIYSQLRSLSLQYVQYGRDEVISANRVRSKKPLSEQIASIRNTKALDSCDVQRENHAAIVIQKFMRKMIAAQSYGKMFANGSNFRKIGHNMRPYVGKASFAALNHLDSVSKYYLKEIREKVTDLTVQEQRLLSDIINTKITLRHQSNSYLISQNKLTIYSHDKLVNERIASGKNTYLDDKQKLSNHDFVFFGVEFSQNQNGMPLNRTHMNVDFGANAYFIEDKFPHGYLTLTDHLDNRIRLTCKTEHKNFALRFRQAIWEVRRAVHGDKGIIDIPIFNSNDMKLALGLHVIDFLRQSNDEILKTFALQNSLTSKELDRLIHFIFQPEFHLPRMVITRDYTEVRLREVTLEDAVHASNFACLNTLIKNKEMACRALGIAVSTMNEGVVLSLFEQFHFTRKDLPFMKIRRFECDLSYTLSSAYSSLTVLKLFVEKRLIDVNMPFVRVCRGLTMLDNAIENNKTDVIEYLRGLGALRGKELRRKNNRSDILEKIEETEY